MNNKYSKKQLEELYNCEITKNVSIYIAYGHNLTENKNDALFDQASGSTLEFLHDNIREKIYEKWIL